VCSAAAKNNHLEALQWLHEQGCPWNLDEICGDAAESGSMEMLLYLKEQGCEYNEDTFSTAVMTNNLAICQHLIVERCPNDFETSSMAAFDSQFEILRLLCEHGRPLDAVCTSVRAAESGSIELLQYFREHDCVYNEVVMGCAARAGHIHICQHLRDEQCPWDAGACTSAARGGQLDTLRWLREHGCPWDIQGVRTAAAESGDLPTIMYALSAEPAASAAQLTEMLNAAGSNSKLPAAKWLRQQGAEWPAVLKHAFSVWKADVLQWARDEGCTSPTEAPTATTAAATAQVRHNVLQLYAAAAQYSSAFFNRPHYY
jgi:hypothetical protein